MREPNITRPDCLTLNVREACELLGLGRSSFYRAIREGRLPAKKLGKRTLVLRADLERFLAGLPDHITHHELSLSRRRRDPVQPGDPPG